MAGGGNGSNFMDPFCFSSSSFFLGTPGKCSQEKGTPENRSGVAGLRGESSGKYKDPSEDDDEEESVRREEWYLAAGMMVSQSFEAIWSRPL